MNLEQYKDTYVTVTVPSFGYLGYLQFVKFLSLGGDVSEVKEKRYGNTKKITVYYNFYKERTANTFTRDIQKIFNPSVVSVQVEQKPHYIDGFARLEDLLSNFDWYYAMSDDHRYYLSGEASHREVNELVKELVNTDRHRVRNILLKYSERSIVLHLLKEVVNNY
jgi:hypothetical protein